MATHCPRCGGDLRIAGRFCQMLWLRCRVCGGQYTQVAPRAAIEQMEAAA